LLQRLQLPLQHHKLLQAQTSPNHLASKLSVRLGAEVLQIYAISLKSLMEAALQKYVRNC
jgi:hypothetical protein